MNIEAVIYGDDDEEIRVYGEYSPAEKGSTDIYGVPMEPDVPDFMEVLDAIDPEGDSITLPKHLWHKAKDALWETME